MKAINLSPLRIGIVAVLSAWPAAHGEVRSSANYSIVAETQDGGGDLASSANYSAEGSLETAAMGNSTASGLVVEHGFLTNGVVVDASGPVITLSGPAVMTLYADTETYTEAGASAYDLVEGVVPVVIGGDTVDPSTPGTYLVTYDATDSEGFAADQVTRTVHVTRPVYYVDADAPDGGDGTSWATAFNKLQDALATTAPHSSQVPGKLQQIWVAAGTYSPDEGTGQTDNDRSSTFLMRSGVSLYGGFSGTETALDQRDPDANLTILTGDIDQDDSGSPGAGNAYHVVTMVDPGNYTWDKGRKSVSTVLDGFTVSGGRADGAAPHDAGGGVLIAGSAMTHGIVQACRITGNAATNGAGIGMPEVSALRVNISEITHNQATLDGGGLYRRTSGPALEIYKVRFESNTARRGGGLYVDLAGFATRISIFLCHVRGNHATASGGGIHIGVAQFNLYNSLVSGNACDGNGGGIYVEETNSYYQYSTLAGNRAGGQGGAMFGERVATVLNSSGQPIDFINNLVWGNEDQDGSGAPGSSIAGAIVGNIAFTTNLIEGFAPGGDNLDGTLATNDPDFLAPQPPANAPTVTGDYQLTSGSPAIDRATRIGSLFNQDLNFVPRGSSPELGAYEYVPADPFVEWIALFYPGESDPSIVGVDADPEFDGLNNVGDFAFGLDPTTFDNSPLVLDGLTLQQRGTPTIYLASTPFGVDYRAVFLRRSDHVSAGLTYTVQFSGDLATWFDSDATPTVLEDHSDVELVSVPYPLFLPDRTKARFVRVLTPLN